MIDCTMIDCKVTEQASSEPLLGLTTRSIQDKRGQL